MQIEKIKRKLKRKHLLIVGSDSKSRADLVTAIVRLVNYPIVRFPPEMNTFYDYLDFVRSKNLFSPWYEKRGRFSTNQILDFHREWITQNESLVILEEFQSMEKPWKLELLRYYLEEIAYRSKNQQTIHLLVTQESEENLLDELSGANWISDADSRSMSQVVNGSIEVVRIN